MSVSINIQIISIDNNLSELEKYTTKTSCDQLALMLFDWKGNSYVKNKGILTDEEIEMIKATYGKESISVQDELEVFSPKPVPLSTLIAIFGKIRNKIIYPNIKDAVTNNNEHERIQFTKDLMAISECIGAMEMMQKNAELIYVALEDY